MIIWFRWFSIQIKSPGKLLLGYRLCNSSILVFWKEEFSQETYYRVKGKKGFFLLAKWEETWILQGERSRLTLRMGSSPSSFALCFMGVYLVSSLLFCHYTPPFGSTLVPPLQPFCACFYLSSSHENLSETHWGTAKPQCKWYNNTIMASGLLVDKVSLKCLLQNCLSVCAKLQKGPKRSWSEWDWVETRWSAFFLFSSCSCLSIWLL